MSCLTAQRETAPHRLLIEIAGMTIVCAGLVRIMVESGSWVAGFSPAVWIYAPLLVIALRRLPAVEYGFELRSWYAGGKWFLLSVIFVLIPYFFAAQVYFWMAGKPAGLNFEHLGVNEIIHYLFLIAIPEEIFFRGYLQRRLAEWSKSLGRGEVVFPILLTAFLFALVHIIVEPGWMRVAAFLPGVVMGWLRYRSGGLLAPTGFHWLANLCSIALAS